MLKKMFFASASILMLALAYHLGATSAAAQATTVVGIGGGGGDNRQVFMVVMGNGDTYAGDAGGNWHYSGNPVGGPTPAARPTFGQLKATYRK